MSFNVVQLLKDVFEPIPSERVVLLVDEPHGAINDNPDWQERREMALEWQNGFSTLGLQVEPLVTYPATGANNGDLPEYGTSKGQPVLIAEILSTANIVVAMTEFSASAPLVMAAKKSRGRLRVASMPGVTRSMENTALAEDYHALAKRVHVLADELTQAIAADITFTTGHQVHFDLRYRNGLGDNGHCPPGTGKPLINLPSGEAFIVPYEGEQEGNPSLTEGEIPMVSKGEQVILTVFENRITAATGTGSEATRLDTFFKEDPARANIAELGLGCNNRAVVSGNLLEDEKAGLHWAYGRSEHLGGTVGPDAFTAPGNVIHMDVVYTEGCPIGTQQLTLTYPDGQKKTILRDNVYVIDFGVVKG